MDIYKTVVQEVCKTAELMHSDVDPLDLHKYLSSARSSAEEQINRLIPEHHVRFQMACVVMLQLGKFMQCEGMSLQHGALVAAQYRATNNLLAIYELVMSGLEEAARPLTRAYLEALDIALVILTNESIAEEYFGDDADFDKFWKQHLAYGRVYPHLTEAFKRAGIDHEEIEQRIRIRKNQKTMLSDSVHGGDSGAFRSWAPPPMGYPDMLSLEPHGVANVHTPNHIAALVSETFMYVATMMQLVISGDYDNIFQRPQDDEDRTAFAVSFFAFQARVRSGSLPDGEDVLSPDYDEEVGRVDG